MWNLVILFLPAKNPPKHKHDLKYKQIQQPYQKKNPKLKIKEYIWTSKNTKTKKLNKKKKKLHPPPMEARFRH